MEPAGEAVLEEHADELNERRYPRGQSWKNTPMSAMSRAGK